MWNVFIEQDGHGMFSWSRFTVTFSWSQNVFIKQDGYADTTKGFPLEDTAGSFLQDAKASFYQEACLLAL
jgi:hypothetical protein